MAKKLLSQILRERTETIEYRKIKSQLMKLAQNEKTSMLIIRISAETQVMLQNEGITIEEIDDHGFKKLKLSWNEED